MLRTLWISLAIAFLAAFSSAFSLDDLHIDGIEAYIHQGQRRQASGTGNTPPPPTSTPARPPTSSRGPASTPQNTPSQPQSSPQSNPPQSTPQSSNRPASSTPPASQTTPPPKSSPSVITSALVSTSLQEITSVFTSTMPDGQEVTMTSVSTNEVPITTGMITKPASTQGDNGGGSGLSKSNKNIIGGVVGGVGGALLLGGIALVFLRMRKRQARVHEDDDDMTLGTGSALGDKHVAHNTPFQSNLEQYHNPGGRPNAAANF